MDPKLVEVTQLFERFKAAFVRNDFGACTDLLSHLKVRSALPSPLLSRNQKGLVPRDVPSSFNCFAWRVSLGDCCRFSTVSNLVLCGSMDQKTPERLIRAFQGSAQKSTWNLLLQGDDVMELRKIIEIQTCRKIIRNQNFRVHELLAIFMYIYLYTVKDNCLKRLQPTLITFLLENKMILVALLSCHLQCVVPKCNVFICNIIFNSPIQLETPQFP